MTMRNNNIRRLGKTREGKNITRYILFVVAGILAISSVLMTVEGATSSLEVSNLHEKERQLTLEKRSLEGNLVKSLSINDLGAKIGEMGYIKPGTLVYISQTQEAMAKLP